MSDDEIEIYEPPRWIPPIETRTIKMRFRLVGWGKPLADREDDTFDHLTDEQDERIQHFFSDDKPLHIFHHVNLAAPRPDNDSD